MIATSILSVGVLAMGSLQGIALKRNVDSTELTRATNLANEMMERIQFNRKNVTAYNGIDTTIACAQNPLTQPMTLGDCTQWRAMMTSLQASGVGQSSGLSGASGVGVVRGTVQVTPIATTPSLGQSWVVVTITWSGLSMGNAGGATRTVRLNAFVAPE